MWHHVLARFGVIDNYSRAARPTGQLHNTQCKQMARQAHMVLQWPVPKGTNHAIPDRCSGGMQDVSLYAAHVLVHLLVVQTRFG